LKKQKISDMDTPESRLNEKYFIPERKQQLLSNEQCHSDYTDICRTGGNSAWAVWVSYKGVRDRISVCKYENGKWQKPFHIPDVEGDIYKPACSVGSDGKLMVVWPMQTESCWDLWYCIYDGKSWTKPTAVLKKEYNDFTPRIKAFKNSGYALVWQGWENDSFQILYSEYSKGSWSTPVAVGLDGANNWSPDITVSEDDTVSICWDTYKWGSYDVYVRQNKNGNWGEPVIVAGTPHFEANSSIDSDSKGNVWIAYEERQVNWGKDKSYMTSYIEDEFETLVGYCRVRVCYYTNKGKLMRPFQPREQQINMHQWGGDHLPKISIGDDDRVWLMFRRPDVEMKVFRNYQRLIPIAAWKN
jgi:hypothetical protein